MTVMQLHDLPLQYLATVAPFIWDGYENSMKSVSYNIIWKIIKCGLLEISICSCSFWSEPYQRRKDRGSDWILRIFSGLRSWCSLSFHHLLQCSILHCYKTIRRWSRWTSSWSSWKCTPKVASFSLFHFVAFNSTKVSISILGGILQEAPGPISMNIQLYVVPLFLTQGSGNVSEQLDNLTSILRSWPRLCSITQIASLSIRHLSTSRQQDFV